MLRSLSLQLQGEPETQLPLTRSEDLIKTDDVLDLSKTQPAARSIKIYRKKMQTKRADLFIYCCAVLCLNRRLDGRCSMSALAVGGTCWVVQKKITEQ